MSKLGATERLGLKNAIFSVLLLALGVLVLYPVTEHIKVAGVPIMGWGLIGIGLVFIIQAYVFLSKAEFLESENGEEV